MEGTARLIAAARRAGIRHLVYVSIVGVNRIPFPYYRRKLAAERLVSASDMRTTIVRATQFFPFVDLVLSAIARLPLLLLPTDLLGQPIDAGEVADMITEAIVDERDGLLEIGGPEVFTPGVAAAEWVAARGERRRIAHVHVPGAAANGFRRGHATTSRAAIGGVTWATWLARRYGAVRE